MNIRFDTESLRLRITKEECQALLAAGQLQETIRLPQDHKIIIKVLCHQDNAASCGYKQETIEFKVNKQNLENLLRKSPTRDNLNSFYESLGKQIRVSLEIDVKLKRS
jgi:hypothetical protein